MALYEKLKGVPDAIAKAHGRWYDPWGIASTTYHTVTGAPTAKEKRAQARQVNDQIKAYSEQTRIAKEELDQKRASAAAEKRRINEKQIRALRGSYRSKSILNAEVSEPGMNTKLGD